MLTPSHVLLHHIETLTDAQASLIIARAMLILADTPRPPGILQQHTVEDQCIQAINIAMAKSMRDAR